MGWFDIKMPCLHTRWAIPAYEEEEQNRSRSLLSAGTALPDPILSSSPVSPRRAVYQCARYFQKERGYDFTQYAAPPLRDEPTARAFLFFDPDGFLAHPGSGQARYAPGSTVIGATCFRRRWYSGEPVWVLQWIWLHPYVRRHGHLTAYWPYFKARFGDFAVSAPLSDTMQTFLTKQSFDTSRIVRG